MWVKDDKGFTGVSLDQSWRLKHSAAGANVAVLSPRSGSDLCKTAGFMAEWRVEL